MELGRDLGTGAVARFAELPSFAAVRAAHARNAAPLPRSTVRATISDTTFWAEGMDVDPRSGTIYVAGIRNRSLAAIDAQGQVRTVLAGGPQMGAALAVRVDTARNALWVTTSGIPQMAGYAPADSGISALLRVNLRTGVVERRWDVPVRTGGHVLGDVAVGSRGDVYFTDSSEPVLYRLRAGADTLERYTHTLFRSLQGIATPPGDTVVYVADYSHGLLRVDLRSRAVVRLADAPRSTSLGCDGIAWDGNAIVAVQNGVAPARVMRFALDASGTRITAAEVVDRNSGVASDPTIGTIVGREFVYVANSQWALHDDAGAVRQGARLQPTHILAAPLPTPAAPRR
jgi:sugar lactone lactonase YvrE